MTPGRFKGWTRPGPIPPGDATPEAPEPGVTLDYLSGSWRVFQYERGHRYSTDDLLVAWYGTQCAPHVSRAADLGSGIGSVALMAAWRLAGTRFVTVEAQEISVRLARRSVAYNGLADRFRVLCGDFRDPEILAGEEPFDLVLGSPPYFRPGTVTAARHAQAVPARIELRGDVLDYARAAERVLAPGGLFACVYPERESARVAEAFAAAGLVLLRRRDVVFREGEPPRISLYASSRRADLPEGFGERGPWVEPPLVIRLRNGLRHPEYALVRLSMGFPPGEGTPTSSGCSGSLST